MNCLFDLQHPAHLHVFRPLIGRLKAEGHSVLVTGRDKDILVKLAAGYGIEVEVFGTARKGVLNLGMELIYRQWRLNRIIRRFKPDIMMAVAGTFISLLGKLRRIPTYVFYDTEHATISNLLAYPFATCIYVPQCYRKPIRWNHVRYNGYHELAYLHPDYFRPDPSVLDEVGVKPGEIFSLVRLVGWGAGHDIGRSGFTPANKIRAVETLQKYGKVFISSEGGLPAELEPLRLRLAETRIHSLMSYASLIFGESATMVSEGAVLGVPGVYVDPVGRGYTDEQEERYGIVFHFTDSGQDAAIGKGEEILAQQKSQHESQGADGNPWRAAGRRIIAEKVDLTRMMYDLIRRHDG